MSRKHIIPLPHQVKHSGFYVYAHRINGCVDPFYIGKGKDKRAWATKSRNKTWHDISSYGDVIVEILQCDLTEENALLLEKWMIAMYRHHGVNLANLASGGVRGGGWSHTKEAINRMSLLKSGCNNPNYGRKHKYSTREIMSQIASGSGNPFYNKKHSERAKTLISEKHSGHLNACYNDTEYDFWHPSYGNVTCTQNKLRKTYNLKHGGVSSICSGRQLTHYGWRLMKNKDASEARVRGLIRNCQRLVNQTRQT